MTRADMPYSNFVKDWLLLGRYGVWLMVGLCTPVPDTPDEMLQRLISGLFRWFHTTSYSYTGELADQVEKLKSMHVCRWLAALSGRHRRAAVACLSPQLCAANRLRRLHKRLCRLYCLIPYGVITQEIWDSIMPEWMDAICSHVNEKDLDLFKNIIKKIMEPDGAMAGVQENHMYDFVANKLTKEPSPHTAMPALIWLQRISEQPARAAHRHARAHLAAGDTTRQFGQLRNKQVNNQPASHTAMPALIWLQVAQLDNLVKFVANRWNN
ncbi:unnamed protein product [Plutella xylostella]|uniref:(diamondback moth) hypothetical protein n=1 Tax=Plutella xylostella TaxID=51655 RepID=A0A8S4FVM2_PLUXY|nr:unnamed protein product [Plutella xylostella]